MLLGVSINLHADRTLWDLFHKIITKNETRVNNKIPIITNNQCR